MTTMPRHEIESSSRFLRVNVVAIAFRAGLEALETFQTALSLDPGAACWALMSEPDALKLRSQWEERPSSAILIARESPDEVLDVACHLLALRPEGPIAVLLANFPPRKGILPVSSHKAEAETIRRLESAHPEVQVHIHRPDWLRRPPRIR
jgi:hypothetical protein